MRIIATRLREIGRASWDAGLCLAPEKLSTCQPGAEGSNSYGRLSRLLTRRYRVTPDAGCFADLHAGQHVLVIKLQSTQLDF